MNSELRVLGGVQGLLLGLILAAPLLTPTWMPWGIQALFALSAFHLRLADRRWALRPGWQGWISHIRMAPARMLPWTASAVVTFIAGVDGAATPAAILGAALVCELLLYPLLTHVIGSRQRRAATAAMLAAMVACALAPAGIAQNIAQFALGVTGCIFWLRGPDGDLRSTLAALGGGLSATILCLAMPAALPLAFPLATICLTLALAQGATVRRQLLPWTPDHGINRRWPRWMRLGSRPS